MLGKTDVEHSTRLEQHVAECSVCIGRAGDLPAVDELVTAMQSSVVDDPERTDLVRVLIPLLRRMQPETGGTAAWSAAPTVDHEPASSKTSYRFLAPPQVPGELGQLGPYRIQAVLGAGGMGVVFRAYDPRLLRSIAMKVVRPDLVTRPGALDRLIQEAQAAAAVEHDHIVAIYSVEEHDGVPCIVMPLLRGRTLEQRMRTEPGPFPYKEVLRIGAETAMGLAGAHERGLIHRDIKPANLWLEEPLGRVKILDFGLAMLADADGPAVIAGTPGYMAPEQVLGGPVDHRADLFALGCVLYRVASGVSPFGNARTFTTVVMAVLEKPRPLFEVNPNLPAAFAKLVDQLLEQKPDARPQSVKAVLAELEALQQGAAKRTKQISRRRWLFAVTGCAAGTAVGTWAIFDEAPVPPVDVTFEADGPALTVVSAVNNVEQTVDGVGESTLALKPGEYELRPLKKLPNRKLYPDRIMVEAGVPQKVRVTAIGEVARHSSHTRNVTGLAIVTTGDKLAIATVSLDRTLTVWNTSDKENPKFVNLPCETHCVAASGTLVATAGGNKTLPAELSVRLWDAISLRAKGDPLPGHKGIITAAALSHDGKWLITGDKFSVRIWDLVARTTQILEGHEHGRLFTLSFSPDGKQALSGGEDGKAGLWDLDAEKPKLHRVWDAHKDGVRGAVFLTKGYATAGEDGLVKIWDARTFQSRELVGHEKPVMALAASKDGTRLLSGGADGTVRLWATTIGKLVVPFTGHVGPVTAVAFTPDGRQAASGGVDRTVRLWQLPY